MNATFNNNHDVYVYAIDHYLRNEAFDEDIIAAYNYMVSDRKDESLIYSMNEFDEIMYGEEPYEVARKVFYGDFRPADNYFKFNGYDNLESFNYFDEYCEDIADYFYGKIVSLWDDEVIEMIHGLLKDYDNACKKGDDEKQLDIETELFELVKDNYL